MSTKPFPLPILIDLLRERIEVAQQYEKVAGIGCLGELIPQAVEQLERLRDIEDIQFVIVEGPPPGFFEPPSFWRTFIDNWRRRRAERRDLRVLSGETLVREMGRLQR